MNKVLIITYYWPPSGGSGVQRWLKFVKYLAKMGWEPYVYTPENPSFTIQDPSLLKDVPESVEILKLPIWEPY
ncbi:MAG: glycosyl transferase, partial [Cyclobacteriaceae bacterium]